MPTLTTWTHWQPSIYSPIGSVIREQTYGRVENNTDVFVSQASAKSVKCRSGESSSLPWQHCLVFHTWMEKYIVCVCVFVQAKTHTPTHTLTDSYSFMTALTAGYKAVLKAQGHAGAYMLTHTTIFFPPNFLIITEPIASQVSFCADAHPRCTTSFSLTKFLTAHTKHIHTKWNAGAIKRQRCLTCPWNWTDDQHAHSLYYMLYRLCLELTVLSVYYILYACSVELKYQRVGQNHRSGIKSTQARFVSQHPPLLSAISHDAFIRPLTLLHDDHNFRPHAPRWMYPEWRVIVSPWGLHCEAICYFV